MVVVQIGANKGYDDLTEILKDKEVDILILVEPFSELNDSLKMCYSNINNLFIENLIICDDENQKLGEIFYHTDDSSHENRFELASIHKTHSLKIRPHYTLEGVIQRSLPSITINQLFKKYGLKEIDILFIDTEGFDDKILESLNFDLYDIKEIYYENLHINIVNTRNFLKTKGFEIVTNVGWGGWSDKAKKTETTISLPLDEKNSLLEFFKIEQPTNMVFYGNNSIESVNKIIFILNQSKLENYTYFFTNLQLFVIDNMNNNEVFNSYSIIRDNWDKVVDIFLIEKNEHSFKNIQMQIGNKIDLLFVDTELITNLDNTLTPEKIINLVGGKPSISNADNNSIDVHGGTNKKIVNEVIKVQHDAGFFSVCNINLKTVIGYYSNTNKFCLLDTSEQWNWYKDEPIDVYHKFFKFNEDEFSISPQNFSNSNDEDQFSDYRMINYDFVNPFVHKYFSFSDEVIEIEKSLIQKYNIDLNNTISVCFRGNDKIKETDLPSYEEMGEKLFELLSKYPNKKVIIQSDEIEFCDFMRGKNENFIIFDEIEKISRTPYAAIQYTIPIGRKIENAQTFMAIMSIISKSEYVILNSGNVGLWICLFRGNANNVFQYLNPKGSNKPMWINYESNNQLKINKLEMNNDLKIHHFFGEIDGWSEIERQGVLLETLLNEIDNGDKINVAEIGVYKGRGTAIWNVMLINRNINYDYYAIDNFLGSSEHQKNVNYYDITLTNLQPIIDRIKIIKNDSLDESKKYSDEFFDIVYIDASHDYESVTKDIKHWYPKVKKGGFICGDDYTDIWTDVKKSVQDFFGDNFDVVGETQWYSKK